MIGGYAAALGRWQVDADSLQRYLEAGGYVAPQQPPHVVGIVAIGTPGAWFSEFAAYLPAGHTATIAHGLFEAGRVLELVRPTVAVVDFRIGRNESLELGRRLDRLKRIALANEDEEDRGMLTVNGYSVILQKPVSPQAAAEAVRCE